MAPTISSLEHFLKSLPSRFKAQMAQSVPYSAQPLLTSRLQGKLYSMAAKAIVDPKSKDLYSVVNESQLLIVLCSNPAKEPLSFLEDKNIVIKSGSKVFIHRDENGNVVAMVVAPVDGSALKSSSEFFSSIEASKYDAHSITSSCELRIE